MVPEGTKLDLGKVLQGDRFFALLMVRALTYGPEYAFGVSCRNDNCRARIEWEVDLTKLPVRKLSEESRVAFASGNRFETTLPDAGKKVAFKLLTGDDERKLPALQLDPQHADAHNHLGIASLDARKLKDAEVHFRAAAEGGQQRIERDGPRVPWAIIQNRPYLRALGNLALALAEQRKWAEALAIHQRILTLNPNDNQGVRYLIGVEHLRVGDNQGAIKAFAKCLGEEVGSAFGLALARLRAFGPSAEVGQPLLLGFAGNRYVAPMLLGERWERLDAFHGSTMAEPEWADDVVKAQADLWHAVPRGAEILRFWWASPAVAAWREKLDNNMAKLKSLPISDERNAVVAEGFDLRSETVVRDLERKVCAAS